MQRGLGAWPQVGFAAIAEFLMVGMFFYSIPVYFPHLLTDIFGGSRGQAALMSTIFLGSSALYAPPIGMLIERITPRWSIALGSFLYGASFWWMAQAQSAWMLFFVIGVPLSISATMLGGIAPPRLVADWFQGSRQRGVALGVAGTGISMGGVVFPGIATWLLTDLDWRGAIEVYGYIAMLVAPLFLLVIRMPKRTPQPPDADTTAAAVDKANDSHAWTARRILLNKPFIGLVAVIALQFGCIASLYPQLGVLLRDDAIATTTIAILLSLTAGCAVAGKIAAGVVQVIVGRTGIALAIFCGLQVLGLLGILVANGPWQYGAALMVWGLGYGAGVPLLHMGVAEIFPLQAFTRALGYSRPLMVPIQMAGAPFAGILFDLTGNYDIVLLTFACLMTLAVLISVRFKPQKVEAG